MRISDWSSDVCSSDLIGLTLDRNEARGAGKATIAIATARAPVLIDWLASLEGQGFIVDQLTITPAADGTVWLTAELRRREIGRAQCRESVCQYSWSSVGDGSLKDTIVHRRWATQQNTAQIETITE